MVAFFPFLVPIFNAAESIIDACRDSVKPKVGSVLYCDLLFGYMDHSGIYIGDNKIVQLSGDGNIKIVSPKQFIDDSTACNIYVSCYEDCAVGSNDVAKRAKSMIGTTRGYNFLLDNCHQFTAGCLTGDFDNSCNFLLMLKDEASIELGSNTWRYWDIDLF